MADPSRVLEDVLSLDPQERARIAHELIASLEATDEDAARLWREEIRRRIDALEAGKVELEDWNTVRAHLRASVGR